MAKKKEKSSRYSWISFFRLAVFLMLIIIAINYLSTNSSSKAKNDPTVLGVEDNQLINIGKFTEDISHKIYQSLPQKSQDTITNLPSSPVIIQAQEKIDQLGKLSREVPQDIIKEAKKYIIKSIYQQLMDNLESGT